MVNNEHLPIHDIDEYLNPPLHPDYDPQEIAAKLAVKRAKISDSMRVFGKYQAEAAAKRAAEK